MLFVCLSWYQWCWQLVNQFKNDCFVLFLLLLIDVFIVFLNLYQFRLNFFNIVLYECILMVIVDVCLVGWCLQWCCVEELWFQINVYDGFGVVNYVGVCFDVWVGFKWVCVEYKWDIVSMLWCCY